MQHAKQLELIQEVKNESNRSYKILLNEYKPLIKSQSKNFKSIYAFTPIEVEDIENMMSFFFYELVLEFDETIGKTFAAYIKEFLYYRTST
jgi:DNA-directed RNA polymerase specialized sigma subunit